LKQNGICSRHYDYNIHFGHVDVVAILLDNGTLPGGSGSCFCDVWVVVVVVCNFQKFGFVVLLLLLLLLS